jgi:DNA-binding SARP family transcriptional activator/streptogramin lyase
MEFHILGPLEVIGGGEAIPLGGSKQRALLGLLLLRPNEPVSVDRIVDELWGEHAPPTAAKNVQVYVSHLRKALGESAITTTPAGYALHVADGSVDAQQAEDALALALGQSPEIRIELLEGALSLWRGLPFGELGDLPAARAEIVRLDELRLHLLKRRIEAALELGRHEEVVPELEKLVAAHPLDERLRAQLMLALYQSGRQADALAVYRDARRALDQELGLEPDEELRALQQRILAHDPSLRPPPVEASPQPGPHVKPRRRHPVPRSLLLGAALIALAAFLAAVVARARGTTEPIVVPANALAVVDAARGEVIAAIPVGRGPASVVAGAGAVWVANVGDRTLSRVDPGTLRVTKTVGLGFEPTDLAADGEHVWVAGGYDHVLWRVDRDGIARLKLPFVERLPLPIGFERGRAQVALTPGSVWLSHGRELTELDSVTGEFRQTVPAGGRWQREIAADGDDVWVSVNSAGRPALAIVDGGRTVERTRLINSPGEIVFGARSLWAAIWVTGAVWQVDPTTGLVQRTIAVGNEPEGLVFFDDSLWVTNERDAIVRRVDARSGETEVLIPIGNALEELAAADGRLFVAVRGP